MQKKLNTFFCFVFIRQKAMSWMDVGCVKIRLKAADDRRHKDRNERDEKNRHTGRKEALT